MDPSVARGLEDGRGPSGEEGALLGPQRVRASREAIEEGLPVKVRGAPRRTRALRQSRTESAKREVADRVRRGPVCTRQPKPRWTWRTHAWFS